MIYALFLLASLGFASSTETVSAIDSIHLSNINKDIRELQSGRPVITGIPKYKNGISFGGSTVLIHATTGFYVTGFSGDVTQTAGSACVSGSTGTITLTTPGDVDMWVSLSQSISVPTVAFFCGIEVDGVSSGDLQYSQNPGTDTHMPFAFSYRKSGLSATQHNFCVYCYVAANTANLTANSVFMGRFIPSNVAGY